MLGFYTLYLNHYNENIRDIRMKNLKITLAALGLISSSAFAGMGHFQEKMFINKGDKETVKLIEAHPELIIDHMSSKGFELYGPEGTKTWLESIGIDYSELSDVSHTHNKDALADYPTFEEIEKFLKTMAAKYPKIAKLESIGKSVQGRDLYVLKISDNVEIDEVEPEFKYISSMHGDEITGRELTQFLIKDLLEGYGTNQRFTDLINNTELYIMPSMNPDGSKRRRRANARNVDLNRNFPNWDAKNSSKAGRQVETKAVMDFQASRQFSLSANFHGGAVCVNYPWDSTLVRHPFDGLLQDVSKRYSRENRPMWRSGEFTDGITNGADWYVVKGGMQDWSYVFHNDLQVTIELSDAKWPRYSKIPQFYKENKESMLVYAEAIHQGGGFKLSDKNATGTVKIKKLVGSKKLNQGSFGFRGGEFYKVLPAGKYELTVKKDGKRKKDTFTITVKKNIIGSNGNYQTLSL
jgi:hypothetical protein